uniref:SCAN box domain-containing protein n=1 Tax=Pundamilia nyererei TaxID=303518 RepID=A0A3B4GYV4_9CICH
QATPVRIPCNTKHSAVNILTLIRGTGPLHMLMHNAVARDAAWANKEEAPLLNLLVLQQFVEALPAGTAEWVHYHQQASLKLAITLAKDHWKLWQNIQPKATRYAFTCFSASTATMFLLRQRHSYSK